MAGNKNSGGAFGGPQYNPANVNGLGGNGQSGAASGFKYGMNKMINDQREMGNTAVATVSAKNAPPAQLPRVTQITEKTELPNQSVMDGAPIGDGANSIPGLPSEPEPNNIEFDASIRSYSQILKFVASQPSTSKETRSVISTLLRGSEI